MREWRTIVIGALCVMLAACGGGSGSTGLITSEDAVIDGVRSSGTCDTFDGATYCATDSPDAVAPGGQSVSLVTPGRTPVGTPTPGAAATGTPGGVTSSTPVPPTPTAQSTAAPATATPIPMPTATPHATRQVTVVVDGFDAGAACATAARTLGSDAVWETAPLVPVASGVPTTFLVATDVLAPLDLALLCFDHPPDTLPMMLATLADAEPTVVFVLPSP
jgi:hypothetical protein